MNSPFKPELLHFIDYRIVKINIHDLLEQNMDIDSYFDVSNSISLGFNVEKNIVKSDLEISIKKLNSNDDSLISEANVLITYLILVENFDLLHKLSNNDELEIDKMLTDSISAIVYSTTRGILLDKLKDSSFENFILPIIDIKKDLANNSENNL